MLCVSLGVALPVPLPTWLGLCVDEGVGEALGVSVCEPLSVALGVGAPDALSDCVLEPVPEGDAVWLGV